MAAGKQKKTFLDIALKDHEAGEYLSALEVLEALVQEEPDNVPAWSALARTSEALGRTQRAGEAWRQCQLLEPGQPEAMLGLALLIYSTLGPAVGESTPQEEPGDDQAEQLVVTDDLLINQISATRQALKKDPDNADLLTALGLLLFRAGYHDESSHTLHRVVHELQVGPASLAAAKDALTRLAGQSYKQHGDRLHAIMVLAAAIKYLKGMGRMQINEIIIEIVSLNSRGMTIHDMHKTYTVSHLDGAELTALGLMCVLYAAFREIDEPVNIGFDFSEEYESALVIADDYGRLGTFM